MSDRPKKEPESKKAVFEAVSVAKAAVWSGCEALLQSGAAAALCAPLFVVTRSACFLPPERSAAGWR
ncbi:hypothetical protein COCON_G00194540 [Conger conger]|uniref:Uncharacterized protein n=1 Tax=Conger conger TaxID=82655 RepID=A0A9Q1HQV3_CONCO|nr:hypothetical protein COCON_G00194540 [Conger conger]